jgi:glycosyltransferase involved in cell wall biosynthesis
MPFARVLNRDIRVSVILNYYEKESTLFQCIDRLLQQSLTMCAREQLEIILVDDGTEGEDVRDRLPDSVIYLWQRKNRYGITRAKNTGAKVANGDYLIFLDPDILVSESFIDTALRGFARFGDRVVQTGYIWDYFFVGCPDPRTEFGVWNIADGVSSRFYQLAGGNLAISRRLFLETPGFDEDLIFGGVEDLLFGYHVGRLPSTGVYFNRELLSWHIPHPPSLAHADCAASWQIVKEKHPAFYDEYITKGLR